jgi:hypothetical protein
MFLAASLTYVCTTAESMDSYYNYGDPRQRSSAVPDILIRSPGTLGATVITNETISV